MVKRFFKFLSYGIGIIMMVLIVIILGAYIYFRGSLPDYSGQIQLAGLKDKVVITRDENALPHIVAQNSQDVYFAMGYVHAQDRLWQMQLHRHIAMGRLSELVGENGLDTDKFLRTLGMYDAAKKSYHLLTQQTKTQLEAYSAGVNAYIAEDHILPIEFTILQLDNPKPWRPIETVAWMKIMAWDLNSTWRKELDRLIMAADFTPAQIADYHPPYPGDKVFTPPNPEQLYGFKLNPQKPVDISSINRRIKISDIIDNQTIDGIGSNNWVISGGLSQSGKPLLANDPHLALTAPALWYHVHLKAEDGSINAIGSTMPGVPYIILGRNENIAWGFTNADPDAQDLFVEKITRDGFYKTPTGEASFEIRQEVIKVKGAEDYNLTIRSTRHGPILSDRLDQVADVLGKNHVLALRWTALDDDSRSLDAAAKLATANNWQEFKQAVRHFKAPQQSVVYADIEGNIGFIAPGAVPIRHRDNELYGQFPAPGWIAKYDWQGYISFNELPQKLNPKKGYIATANHKYVDDDYPHYIASKWTLPFRYNRIIELIDANPKHTLKSIKTIQLDQYSKFIETMRPILDSAIINAGLTDKRSIRAHQMIKNWNGVASVDSKEMLIFTLWTINIQGAILADKFDQNKSINHLFLENVLTNQNNSNKWCGALDPNITTSNDCDQLVSMSLTKTVNQISDQLGADMNTWQWGNVHFATGAHRIFDKVGGLNTIFNIVRPVGGGKTTINVASFKTTNGSDLKKMFKNTHGPSLRHLFDLSDLEKSLYIHSSGQSGNILSPYYAGYVDRWIKGDFIPMVMEEVNYLPGAIGRLELKPKPINQ